MKKTVSINLNGLIFNIDEDAYFLLSEYLKNLNDHFLQHEEGAEIINDIEARIAEIFSELISSSKQVINIVDVENLISQLGKAEEIIGNENEEDSNEKTENKKKNKKLYRDSENRILGGVCAGLSLYTGLSLIAVRIIFSILFLFSAGFMILVYLILWIIIPKAKTVAERLEMQGKDINITNIENTIKEEYNDLKNRFSKIKDSNNFKETTQKYGNDFVKAFNKIFKALGKIIAVLFISIGIFLIVVFSIGIFSFGSEHFVFEIAGNNILPIPHILQMFTSKTISILFIISIIITCFIPLISIVYVGFSILFRIKSRRIVNLSLLILWIMGLAMIVALSISISTNYLNSGEIKSVETLKNTNNRIYVYSNNLVTNNDNTEFREIGNYKIIKEGKNYFPIGQIDINILSTNDSLPYIEIIKTSKGSTKSEAKQNAKNISYKYEIQDSVLKIDDYFKLIGESKLREQKVNLVVYLPNFYSIQFDENSLKYLDSSIMPEYNNMPRIPQAVFQMKNNELLLVSQ